MPNTRSTELTEEWDLDGLVAAMESVYGTGVTVDELKGLDREAIVQEFLDDALDAYAEREKELDQIQEGLMRDLERFIVLQTVDIRWREHLENMDYMREGIHLRGMAQKDPLVEYRNEGHVMFQELNRAIREEVVTLLFHAEVTPDDAAAQLQQPQQNGCGERRAQLRARVARRRRRDPRRRQHVDRAPAPAAAPSRRPSPPKPKVNSELENIGRNDPCWCGSGKKFKKCHGA